MRKMLFCLFGLYGIVLAGILFAGRTADLSVPLSEYFACRANVVPFQTLSRYIGFFLKRKDEESFLLAIRNIGGNFLLFMPMGFLLPALFSDMRKFGGVFRVIFLMVLSAEIMQGVLRVGVPDIDDLIVNLAGACVGFLFFGKIYSTEYRSI